VALRSVVLTPPPGAPRRTVVLRAGGPREKGRTTDVAAAVVGALLLLSCVVLVQVLPDKEYALPQFRISFPATLDETTYPPQPVQFLESPESSRVQVFSFELPDNVPSITLVTFFQDDVAASLPDQFRVELYDPRGNPVGPRDDLINSSPRLNTSDPLGLGLAYDAGSSNLRLNRAPGSLPTEQIVAGLTHRETAEQALARLEPQHRLPTAGTWTVRVSLLQAGDCPQPTGPDPNPQRTALCFQERDDGVDVGNSFTLGLVFTTYKMQIEELS
jgi:hypothetical protein